MKRIGSGLSGGGWRWTVGRQMAAIGAVGLAGILLVVVIGYSASGYLAGSAGEALHQVGEARVQYARASQKAMEREGQARMLGEINRDLLLLLQKVVDSPAHPEKGISAEDILKEAQGLAEKAEVVRGMPGSEKKVPGTRLTLGDQIIGNFKDVATLIEYELPALYEAAPGTEGFQKKQNEILVSMTGMYWFISRTFGDLTMNLKAEVETSRAELDKVCKEADRVAAAAENRLISASRLARLGLLAASVLTILLLVPLFALFRRRIVSPLMKTVVMVESLRKGRVAARLEVGRREDEFGEMAQALNAFADDLEQDVTAHLQSIARGELDFSVHPADEEDVIRITLRKMVNDLNQLLGRILSAGEEIALGSAQVADSSQTLSQGATESASSLQEISASLTELTAQTRGNAESAAEANRLSRHAREMAEKGDRQMLEMTRAMEEINEAGDNISKIARSIDNIAFQTNLLALNAAVEAARAGSYGKGFAVVAEEVRKLAAQSSEAARETTELIGDSVRRVERGAEVSAETAATLREIVRAINRVADLVAEIDAASREQAVGLSEVSQGLGQIDQVTQRNTAIAEESAAAAQELSGQAADMKQMLHHFRLRADRQSLPEN